jgi:hypothetical protein
MEHHHVKVKVKAMVTNYFKGIKLRFSYKGITTEWLNLDRGIVTGCTISPILSIMGMNLVITAMERENRGPKM